jgi:ribosomal protein S18 acetylase RimI-like enzyme
VDDCRPHLDLPVVLVRPGAPADRAATLDLFMRDFGHTRIVAFGERIVLDEADVLVAEVKGELAGALAYRMLPDAVQLLALATDPMWQRSGVGAHLIEAGERLAAAERRPRVVLSTTNDNLPALYFYQRQGYRIQDVVPGGHVKHAGTASPAAGFAGIPIRDEIRLVKDVPHIGDV